MAQRRFLQPRRGRLRDDPEPVHLPRRPVSDTSDSSRLVERIDEVLADQ